MPRTFSVSVVFNDIERYQQGIQRHMQEAVDETATAIQRLAAQIAPRDTGSLAESIYTNNGTQSNYQERVSRAENLNEDVNILEEIDPEFVISPSASANTKNFVSVVGVAAEHGAPNEFGTRFMRPSPFLRPATEGEADDFSNRMSNIVRP
jgi:hypothetical protein